MKLSDEEIAQIRVILAERQQALPVRVEIDKSDVTVKSFRISKRLVDDAVKKSGGNLNRLLEHLLFEFMDRDVKYTKKYSNE